MERGGGCLNKVMRVYVNSKKSKRMSVRVTVSYPYVSMKLPKFYDCISHETKDL